MDMACGIFGGTAPFTPEQLKELYPTHEDYVEKFTQSAEATMAAGFMLDEEGAALIKRAQSSLVPNEYADAYKFSDEF